MELRCENATCSRENGLFMPPDCGGLSRGGERGLSLFARFLPETTRVNTPALETRTRFKEDCDQARAGGLETSV